MTAVIQEFNSEQFWTESPLDVEEFCARAAAFARKLDSARNFDELHRLWQSTKLPYSISEDDPYGAEYLSSVKSLYSRLTGGAYELNNELTSTKVDSAFFEAGFPWATGRLDIISAELAKVVQALKALHEQPKVKRVIEFGSGWGNLAHPMARSGLDVTVVDIDPEFLGRLKKIFAREMLPLEVIHSDFLNSVRSRPRKYDAAVFQASFHHCLEFNELLQVIKKDVLNEDGIIYFLSEPIFENYAFPWGLRFDGESLWAITKNKWLELGFDRGFFSQLLANNGYFLVEIPAVQGIVGCGYKALPMIASLPFNKWILPNRGEASFHRADSADGTGRFCKGVSYLPALNAAGLSAYNLVIANFNIEPMKLTVTSRDYEEEIEVLPGTRVPLRVPAGASEVTLCCATFVPSESLGNGDTRELGLAIVSVSCD